MDLIIEVKGLERLLADISKAEDRIKKALERAFYRAGALVRRDAIANAPISPTTGLLKKFKSQIDRGAVRARQVNVPGRKGQPSSAVFLDKGGYYEKRLTLLTDKAQGVARPAPGGLMKSIMFQSSATGAEVFVPVNSPAGSYARKIHDEKGMTWRKRGPGTQAKGARADDKFIERAMTANEGNIMAIMNEEINKALGGLI